MRTAPRAAAWAAWAAGWTSDSAVRPGRSRAAAKSKDTQDQKPRSDAGLFLLADSTFLKDETFIGEFDVVMVDVSAFQRHAEALFQHVLADAGRSLHVDKIGGSGVGCIVDVNDDQVGVAFGKTQPFRSAAKSPSATKHWIATFCDSVADMAFIPHARRTCIIAGQSHGGRSGFPLPKAQRP
jgi:hypothetical protein